MFSLGNFTLGTLLGLVLGALLGHVLAVMRGKSQKKHEAAIEFRQAIIPTLNELQNGANQFTTIQDSFDSHHKAALKYSAFLGETERGKCLKDLRAYVEWREELYGRDTAEVVYDTESPSYLAARAVNPISHLTRLLAYART